VDLDTAAASVAKGLTKDEVGRVIHAHLSEVRYCYESAMIRSPDIEGKLVVDFTINPSGVVSTTAVNQTTLPDPRLDDCILRRLATWKFPLPRGGVNVDVTYPFIFKSLGR
jgi:TonB family protein